jgi:hypothetical protein
MSAMATEAGTLVEEESLGRTDEPAPVTATAGIEGVGKPAASEKKAKEKEPKGKKSKGSTPKSAKDAPDTSGSPSVAAHPRAARSVARAKGWGGLAGFFIAGYLSLPTGTLAEAGLRALVAGSVCYVAAWAGAVFVWRRLVVLEIKGREQQLLAGSQASVGGESGGVPSERSGVRPR